MANKYTNIDANLTREQLEQQLYETRQLLEIMMENNPFSIFWKDRDLIYRGCNKRLALLAGFNSPEEVIGKTDYEMSWGIDNEVGAEACRSSDFRVIESGVEEMHIIEMIKQENGEVAWTDTSKVPIRNVSGEVVGVLGNLEDITSRKLAEEELKKLLTEKELILKEVHHRVKNNIATIEGLITLQINSAKNKDVVSGLQDTLTRVQSMRILYDKLLLGNEYQEVSIKYYTESLIDAIVAVFPGGEKVTIKKQISDFNLNINKLIPLGTIMNELFTNIFKYAFEGRDSGQITIILDKVENHVTLTLQDNGKGMGDNVDLNKSSGFGLLIVRMLTEQLKGTYTIENNNGIKSTVKFDI